MISQSAKLNSSGRETGQKVCVFLVSLRHSRLVMLLKIGVSFIFIATPLFSIASPLDVYNRDNISLNGQWRYIVDPYENGFYNYRWEKFDELDKPNKNAFFTDSKIQNKSELLEYDFDAAEQIEVPSDWNTQDSRLFYYEGSLWYRKTFDAPRGAANSRVFLNFAAVNYRADVYLNGIKLGFHKGGFTPFYFEITENLKQHNNSLVLKVDNKRHANEVPTLNTDWWNYGGITRGVTLSIVPETFIQNYQLSLNSLENRVIKAVVQLNGERQANTQVEIKIDELGIRETSVSNQSGEAAFEFTLPKFEAWSPKNPKLYKIILQTAQDSYSDSVGLRTIETRGKEILLNGKSIFLKGISVHEEYAIDGGGRVKNKMQAKELLQKAKSLNANYVRLAHYPHSEDTVRLADELGLLVWSEIPVYWTINWNNEETYQNAERQLVEMIERDRNRASIIIWSIANETPVSPSRTTFLRKLRDKAKSIDPTRLISAAMEKHYNPDDPNLAIVTDPLSELVDIVSFNQYIGWYEGLPEKLDRTKWKIPYNKPVIVSEFGAGAVFGLRGNKNERWTEDYQADVYRKTLNMLKQIDNWAGVSPWILSDFRSPRRLHGRLQRNFNRKGLISERGEKKQAYFILEEFYAKLEEN